MYLTREEEEILEGKHGIPKQEALKFLIKYGEALGAERLVSVQSVHTAMAVPEQFAKMIKGNYPLLNQVLLCSKRQIELGQLEVFTTTHVCNIEPYYYEYFGVSEEVMQANREIRAHYTNKGIIFTSTCTPYLVGNIPVRGNHIAWMESSAVVYANLVIGALGNIDGIESTLAAAITGKIPYAGFHIPENRKAKVIFHLDVTLEQQSDFDALGYFIGMGAAMATSGAVQLYHIDQVTPEARSG
ncbi:MAG: aconitase X [Candidatus Helarchaeota archaeon]